MKGSTVFPRLTLRRVGAAGAAILAFAALRAPAQVKPRNPSAYAGQSQSLPATNLYPAGTMEFSAPLPLGVAAGTQCDTNGNIYLQIAPSYQDMMRLIRNREPLNLPLTKLVVGSQEVVTFRASSPQGYTRFSSRAFYVTPRGEVDGLGQACEQGSDCKRPDDLTWLVTAYNDDGSVGDVVKLRPRLSADAFLFLSSFAAFPDGNLLVAGEAQTRDGGTKPYTAVFGRAGDFLADVTLPHDVSAPSPKPVLEKGPVTKAPPAGRSASAEARAEKAATQMNRAVVEGRMVGSPDGTVYLLRAGSPERLYVIGSDGRVLREQDIKTIRPGLTPLNVSVNGQGELVIFYTHISTAKDSSQYEALVLVDPQTGKVISTYKVPPKAGAPACMTSQGVILFTRESKDGHLEVAEYSPE